MVVAVATIAVSVSQAELSLVRKFLEMSVHLHGAPMGFFCPVKDVNVFCMETEWQAGREALSRMNWFSALLFACIHAATNGNGVVNAERLAAIISVARTIPELQRYDVVTMQTFSTS